MMTDQQKAELDRLIEQAGTNYTPAEQELAKGIALMTLAAVGFTPRMAERIWHDDVESRDIYLVMAKSHAVNIRAEAKAARKRRATHYKPSNTPTEKD